MTACPSQDQLYELVNDRLEGAALAEIKPHVKTCSRCQKELESLTQGDRWKTAVAADSGEPSTDGEAAQQLEDDLAGTAVSLAPAEEAGGEPAPGLRGSDPAAENGDAISDPFRTQDEGVAVEAFIRSDAGASRSEWPRVPGYQITERLGQGGMGVVYKARQLRLNRLVALKMIRAGVDARPDLLARFWIEAEAVARFQHPNIVQIHDIGEVAGLPFVSLELLEGGSLADRLDGTPQPGRPTAELLVTLAHAIHAAHLAEIVHRDLKPSNVLFTGDGVPKIADFGLAKRLESHDDQTESGQIMGSPGYMAPEQARGHARDVGPRADVYALGAILYQMLTGRTPFKGVTPIETIRQVINDEPIAPSRLVPRIARDLETICLKCLQKEPHKRYDSAQALADDLSRYLNGETIKARPTPFWERGAKWARRRPLAATLLTLGAAGLTGSLLATFEYQRDRADKLQRENDRIMTRQSAGTRALLSAQKAIERNELNDAKATLIGLREKVTGESAPTLLDLSASAGKLLDEIEQRLADARSRGADRTHYDLFLRRRNEALFHDTQFTGLDLPANQEAVRRAARDALAVFAIPGTAQSWALAPLPPSLSRPEHDQIKQGCYELLLVLADALEQPDESLRLLDAAAGLLPPTTAYHLRRAACLARAGKKAAAENEQRLAQAVAPATAFDHFLMGRDLYRRGDPTSANRHFDLALQRQPDHFWARCLSAICYLRLGRPLVAKVSLSACIEREQEYAWLYVWRGFASSQLAATAGDQLKQQPSKQNKALREEADHEFEAARADYDQALKLLDSSPDTVLKWVLFQHRGLLWLQRDDWAKAAADLKTAIGLDEHRPEPFAALALVYQRQQKPDAAIEQYRRAIALKPSWAVLYRERAGVDLARKNSTPAQRQRALRDIDQAIQHEGPDNAGLARDYTYRAQLLHADGREDDALAACDAALKVRPDEPNAHQLRIELLLKLERYDDVKRSCDALEARNKSSAAIYELRGLARASSKDHAGAIEDFTRAIALRPERAVLYVRRGVLYLVSDAPKLARHDFAEAIRIDPSDSDALIGRAAARVRLGEHRQAVEDAEKALRLSVPTADRLYIAARIYARASAVASAEIRTRFDDTVTLVARYQDRGTSLLREAMQKRSAGERETFWRDVVQGDPDPAMTALSRRLR